MTSTRSVARTGATLIMPARLDAAISSVMPHSAARFSFLDTTFRTSVEVSTEYCMGM